MELKQAKEDLQKRQEALAEELNEIIGREQANAQRKAQVVHEITMNNGEARALKNLSDNGKKAKDKK